MVRISVVLPLPFAPSKQQISPAGTVKETSRKTGRRAYPRLAWRTVSRVIGVLRAAEAAKRKGRR